MSRNVANLAVLVLLNVIGWVGLHRYEATHGPPSAPREAEKVSARSAGESAARELADQLTGSPRVVDAIVIDRTWSPEGSPRTTLLLQEYSPGRSLLPPQRLSFDGGQARFEAAVVQFQGRFLEGHEALRGKSAGLLLKIAGDAQAGGVGSPIDDPGRAPAVYRVPAPASGGAEAELWQAIWASTSGRAVETSGMMVHSTASPTWRFEPGFIYRITVNLNASLDLRYQAMHDLDRERILRSFSPTRPAPVTAPSK